MAKFFAMASSMASYSREPWSPARHGELNSAWRTVAAQNSAENVILHKNLNSSVLIHSNHPKHHKKQLITCAWHQLTIFDHKWYKRGTKHNTWNLEFHVNLTWHKHNPKGRISIYGTHLNKFLWQLQVPSSTSQNPSFWSTYSLCSTHQSCWSFLQSKHHDPCLLISIPTPKLPSPKP
jgi:hypothetical protein